MSRIRARGVRRRCARSRSRGRPAARRSGCWSVGWRWSLRLSFRAFEELPEAIQTGVEHLRVRHDPLLYVIQAPRTEAAAPSPADLLGRHELGVLEDPYVLLQPGQRHPERLRQLADGGAPLTQTLEDAPARGVRERRKGLVELRLILNHVVQYTRASAWVQAQLAARRHSRVAAAIAPLARGARR